MMVSGLLTAEGQRVSPMGLAGNPNMESRCIDMAFAAGVSYFFFYNLSFKPMIGGLNRLSRDHREEIFIATGTEDRTVSGMKTYLDTVRRRVEVDVIDLFFTEYVSPSDDWDAVIEALYEIQKWKANGDVRYVGATVHSRELAMELIRCGLVEVVMHRYNMAHRRSEAEVLPAAQKAGLPVVSFTNTRWGSLLKGHPDWNDTVPSAAECYRYVLNHPAVQVALTAPASTAELEQNLTAMNRSGSLSESEVARWQAYGDLIYGNGSDAFETRWP
jgi:aryl-alcohol dehydrogenase-like predicted oxidoreductase